GAVLARASARSGRAIGSTPQSEKGSLKSGAAGALFFSSPAVNPSPQDNCDSRPATEPQLDRGYPTLRPTHRQAAFNSEKNQQVSSRAAVETRAIPAGY